MKIEMRDPLRELLDSLAGKLTADGFKRKGFTFCKKTDDLFFIINWQKSRDDISGHQKFTVNIGIHSLVLALKEDSDILKCPDIWVAHYRERIGGLLPDGKDVWWTLPTSSNVGECSMHEFSALVENVVLPFFQRFKSTNDLLKLWESGVSPGQTNYDRLRFISLLTAR